MQWNQQKYNFMKNKEKHRKIWMLFKEKKRKKKLKK